MFEDACECADLQLAMIRDNATRCTTTHHDMATALSGDNEANALQHANNFGAGYAGKARHSLPLETS